MWIKDDYQEHMLGYLGGVRAEIERLTHSRIQQFDLKQLRAELDNASELLWWLIDSDDGDWEGFRYPLEACCDTLLRALYPEPNVNALKPVGVSLRPIRSTVYVSATNAQLEPELA